MSLNATEDTASYLHEHLPPIIGSLSNMKEHSTQYDGPCPFCGGKDRFVVFKGGQDRFMCRQCTPNGGDKITFHMKLEGATNLSELVATTGISVNHDNTPRYPKRQTSKRENTLAKEAAKASLEIFTAAPPCSSAHPYLNAKKIQPHGARFEQKTGALLIDLQDHKGNHTSIQRIKSKSQLKSENEPDKMLFKGGKKKGCFHTISGTSKRVFICEGFATGASINEATGCTVLVAIDAHNLLPVAKVAKQMYGNSTRIVIAADNDHSKQQNIGLEKGKAAAHEIKAELVYPTNIKGSDFNDLVNEKGTSTAKHILMTTQAETELKEGEKKPLKLIEEQDCLNVLHCLDSKPDPREYLIEDLIPVSTTGVLNSPGGVGKSNLLLLMAAAIATGTNVKPFKIRHPRKVLIVNVEDSADDIHRRLFALGRVYPEIAAKRELLKQNLLIFPGRGLIGPLMNLKSGNPAISSHGKWMYQSALLLRPDLAILDTKARLYGLDENDNSHAAIWWGLLFEKIMNQLSTCSFLVAAHSGKSRHDDSSQNSNRGASAFIDNARLNLVLTKLDDKTVRDLEIEHPSEYFTMSLAKANYTKNGGTFHFRKLDEGVPKYVNLYNERRSAGLSILIDSIAEYGGEISKRDLTEKPAGKEIRASLKTGANFLKKEVWPLVTYGSETGLLVIEQSGNKTGPAGTMIRLSNSQNENQISGGKIQETMFGNEELSNRPGPL